MDGNTERRRHYPGEENVPLSEAIREAVGAHESTEPVADGVALRERVDVEALDQLVTGTDVPVTLQLNLPNVRVSVWRDDGVDIRVTDERL